MYTCIPALQKRGLCLYHYYTMMICCRKCRRNVNIICSWIAISCCGVGSGKGLGRLAGWGQSNAPGRGCHLSLTLGGEEQVRRFNFRLFCKPRLNNWEQFVLWIWARMDSIFKKYCSLSSTTYEYMFKGIEQVNLCIVDSSFQAAISLK